MSPNSEPIRSRKPEEKSDAKSSLKRYATRIVLAMSSTMALAACAVQSEPIQVTLPSVVPPAENATALASPTITPIPVAQYIEPAAIEQQAVVEEVPGIVAVEPIVNEVIAVPEDDPLFLNKNSYVLKDPTELMQTADQVAGIANSTLQRLKELGIVVDDGTVITASMERDIEKVGCEANSATRHITCYESDKNYKKADASLVVHELIHLLENDSPSYNVGELRATMGAYILSGRNPQIYDRYLFETGFEVGGSPLIFSASDAVKALEHFGMNETQVLQFVFDYENYKSYLHSHQRHGSEGPLIHLKIFNSIGSQITKKGET